jgi:MFS family permease
MAGQADKGNRRALLAIIGEGFLSRLSFGVLNVALPLYAVQRLGFSLFEVGILISLNTMVALATKPLMGVLADRFGHKLSLNVAVALRSAVTIVLAVAAAPWQVFGARAIHGLSVALRDPATGALIAEHGGKKQIAQSFAWYQTAKSVAGNGGKALAPLVLLWTSSNFTWVFLVAFALSLAPVVVVALWVRDPEPEAEVSVVQFDRKEKADKKAAKPAVGRGAIWSFVGLGFMTSATANMLSGLFPVLVVEYAGLPLYVLSILYAIGTAAAFTAPGFGWLSDNVSNKLVLSLRSVANIGSSFLYMLTPNLAGFVVGKALDDMGKAAFKPAWGAMIAELSDRDKKRRGRMFGYMTSGEDAGEIVAPIVAGFIASVPGLGIPVMLGVRIAVAAVAEIYTVAVTQKYLESSSTDAGRRLTAKLALPARVIAGVIVGFGAGYTVGEVREGRSWESQAQSATPGRPPPTGQDCTGDPLVDAIRSQTGGC